MFPFLPLLPLLVLRGARLPLRGARLPLRGAGVPPRGAGLPLRGAGACMKEGFSFSQLVSFLFTYLLSCVSLGPVLLARLPPRGARLPLRGARLPGLPLRGAGACMKDCLSSLSVCSLSFGYLVPGPNPLESEASSCLGCLPGCGRAPRYSWQPWEAFWVGLPCSPASSVFQCHVPFLLLDT